MTRQPQKCIYHAIVQASLVNQTTPTAALDVLHHQHAEEGSGDSGHYSVAQWNAVSRVKYVMIGYYRTTSTPSAYLDGFLHRVPKESALGSFIKASRGVTTIAVQQAIPLGCSNTDGRLK